MKGRKIVFWSFVWLGVVFKSGQGLAQEAPRLSLRDVQEEALLNNPEIRAKKHAVDAAKARVPQARSLDDLMVSYEVDDARNQPFNIHGNDQNRYAISQTIPFPGKLSLRAKVAQKEADMAEKDYKETEKRIISEVKSRYYELFLSHKSIEVIEESTKLLSQLTQIAEVKYSVGEAAQQDVLRAQVELSNLSNQLLTLRQEKETAEAALNILLDKEPISPLGVPEEFKLPPLKWTLEQLQARALETKPELKVFEHAIERNEAAYKLAKKDYFPDFTIKVEYRQTDIGPDLWESMLTLNVPVWFWTKQNYALKQAKAEIEKSQADHRAIRNDVLFQIKDLFVKVVTAQRTVSLFENSILPQSEQTFKASISGYQTNKVDFLSMIDNWRNLLDFQLEYYKDLVNFEKSFAELEWAVGMELVPKDEG